jgi:hypothetical protein
MTKYSALVVGLALVFVPALTAGVTAHHSYSVYDSSNPITVTGVIREVVYEHPHVEVRLEAQGRTWLLDLPAPSRAQARGLTREFLQIGRTITVVGWPHRDGRSEMAPARITFEDTTIQLRS